MTFLLGLDWNFFSPLFLAACVAALMLPEGKIRGTAENLVGLALLLTGMAFLRAGVEPLSKGRVLVDCLRSVGEIPAAVFFLSAAITAVLQSSNAVVAVSIALLAAGLLPVGAVFPLVTGAHVGASAPVLLVSLGTSRRNARRLAWANLFYRLLGASASGLAWGIAGGNRWLSGVSPSMAPPLALGIVVSLNALIFYPLAGLFALAVEKLPIGEKESIAEPLYLDDSALALPSLALHLLAREMARLANFTDELLTRILLGPGPAGRVQVLRRELPLLAESCLDFMFDIPAPPEKDPARALYASISYALIAMRSLVAVTAARMAPLCLEGDCEMLEARLRDESWENMARRLVRLVGFSLGSFVLGDSDLSRRALDMGDAFSRDAEELRKTLLEKGGLFDSRAEVLAWEFLSAADDLVRAASEIARSESVGRNLS